MTAPSPTPRHERFKQLSAEIDDLIARYPAMPPGRPQSICQSEIEKRYREIDELNAEQYAEELHIGQAGPRTPNYPGLGVALAVIATGAALGIYVLIVAGAIGFLCCVGSLSSSRGAPEPPTPASERFQWRP